ncbi:hypothetical protein KCTC52924_03599 [Arenibacter antarcticus]|uniref:Transposase n=1 Tax=Arenibacter antarcticus TaxID=2040469 RepID=A0ABW5VG77_9FLAO|nr:transposase [Arenibacter sp. H213]MCM4169819.1 hypothetical protein [Arenibacter sp. H213]
MDFITGFNRNQLVLMDFESCLSLDSWVRIDDMIVDILPMQELGFKEVLNTEGRPPYCSSDLLKLYIYGYKNKIRSSRRLEPVSKVNPEVIWLLKGLKPSERKIEYFIKDSAGSFRKALRYFVVLLRDWELLDGGRIVTRSFKVAQNET